MEQYRRPKYKVDLKTLKASEYTGPWQPAQHHDNDPRDPLMLRIPEQHHDTAPTDPASILSEQRTDSGGTPLSAGRAAGRRETFVEVRRNKQGNLYLAFVD